MRTPPMADVVSYEAALELLPGLRDHSGAETSHDGHGIEEILDVPPVIMPAVPGFDTATFPYTTEIPFLSNWGTPLLYGPGSIHVAHTDNEHVKIADLHRAVEDYAMLAKHLLAS